MKAATPPALWALATTCRARVVFPEDSGPKAVTNKQLKQVERRVNEKIHQALLLTCSVMPIEEAKKLGAMALFNEKYGDHVRVVAIGAEDQSRLTQAFSREFCGGTHVDNTEKIGGLKVTKEESISAGVRRITALTGDELTGYLTGRSEIIDELSQLLKVPPEQIIERVQKLIEDKKNLTKKLKTAGHQGGSDTMTEVKSLLEKSEKIADTSIIIGQISPAPIDQVRAAIDSLKKKAKSTAIVLAMPEGNDTVTLLAAMTDDVIKKGLKAGDVVKEIAPIVGGGGGGRPQMAQAGGKNPSKLKGALAKAKELIKTKLVD